MPGVPRLLTRAPRLDGVVDRPRLIQAADGATMVVLAGATGSGTTTAAAQIAAADPAAMAWCRLAMGYDRAHDVVAMVADTAGVELEPARRVVDLADQLLDVLDTNPFTIVVDDGHLAADADVDRLLAECSGLLPAGCRIVVAGAARPAGLIGLVSPSDIAVIDAHALAFTDDEAVRLYAQHGLGDATAIAWNHAVAGWALGLVAGTTSSDADPHESLQRLLDDLAGDDDGRRSLLDLASVVPYVTADLVDTLDVPASSDDLAALAQATPLLTDHGGFVRLAPRAADARRSGIDSSTAAELRREAAGVVAADDAATAIDLLLDAGEPDAAADVLADHLSEIGVERALTWLYRLPPPLRRRFPPVLAAGQATVEIDAALAEAQLRVEVASDERARREALFALGSVEAHRGELAAAASAYESALRAAGDDAPFGSRVAAELASTRWLLGDDAGARIALDAAAPDERTVWLVAQLDVASGRPSDRVELAGTAETAETADGDEPFSSSASALRALAGGDGERALRLADHAYALAVPGGGDALIAAAPVRAWALLRAERPADAVAVIDELERRAGPTNQLARVHGAIVRERASRDGDRSEHERDERRLRDLRGRGYASIERLAANVLDGPSVGDDAAAQDMVHVRVLGRHVATVDGRTIRRSDWKSKKAFEVLTVLASAGGGGTRRERVIEAVWPGREEGKGRTLLRTALSEVRRVLEPGRPAGEPSRFLAVEEDRILFAGVLDVDEVERSLADDAVAAFTALEVGLADEVIDAEWAADLPARIERLRVLAADCVPPDAPHDLRVRAAETLIAAEPWQREHYDALAALHRAAGDEPAAADVERRWFADDA